MPTATATKAAIVCSLRQQRTLQAALSGEDAPVKIPWTPRLKLYLAGGGTDLGVAKYPLT